MNEITFILAVLVNKDVITLQEAVKLKKSLTQNVISSNLKDMIEKVSKALEIKESDVETIDAQDILK